MGGLNLHIPAVTTLALMTNRYVMEQACLRVGAPHIRYAENPPDITSIPSTYPCLRSVVQLLAYVPATMKSNPSTKALRKTLVERLPPAKIADASPNVMWKKVWKNIHCPKLSSEQRSALYLVANGKVQHGVLLMRMGRTVSSSCLFCVGCDTLEHKFTSCNRVIAAWDLLQRCIRHIVPGCQYSFQCLRFPVLWGISPGQRETVLRLYANYIIHIIGNNDSVIDLDVLKCSLYL